MGRVSGIGQDAGASGLPDAEGRRAEKLYKELREICERMARLESKFDSRHPTPCPALLELKAEVKSFKSDIYAWRNALMVGALKRLLSLAAAAVGGGAALMKYLG